MKQSKIRPGRCNIIGITGGVGAGKSQVLTYLGNNYSSKLIFSDNVANDIKKKGYPAYDKIVALLGEVILGEDLEIDKAAMARVIFNDKKMLKQINSILHPAVNDYIIDMIDKERAENAVDFVFVEAALLIENGYKDIVDELWLIYADEDTRRERLRASRGYSDDKITEIFKSQLDEKSFRENCDFVIDNSGVLEDTYMQIDSKLGEWRK